MSTRKERVRLAVQKVRSKPGYKEKEYQRNREYKRKVKDSIEQLPDEEKEKVKRARALNTRNYHRLRRQKIKQQK